MRLKQCWPTEHGTLADRNMDATLVPALQLQADARLVTHKQTAKTLRVHYECYGTHHDVSQQSYLLRPAGHDDPNQQRRQQAAQYHCSQHALLPVRSPTILRFKIHLPHSIGCSNNNNSSGDSGGISNVRVKTMPLALNQALRVTHLCCMAQEAKHCPLLDPTTASL